MAPAAPPAPFYVDDEKPFPQRHHGMSLDTVQPHDVPKGKTPFNKDEDLSLKVHDIHRAAPHYRHLDYLQKPDYSVGSTDPDHVGCKARTYYPAMDRRPRDLALTTADIEGAQARGPKRTGNRHTDPLCPHYELPSHHARPVTPPRFNGRHTNDVSDIDHTRSKVLHGDRNYVRDPNHSRDIEFSEPNYQERVKRPHVERLDRSLNVRDITGEKKVQPRCVNPLDPEYQVSTRATTSVHARYSEEHGADRPPTPPGISSTVGAVHGSKSRKLHWDNGEPHFSLLREDIAGTLPQRWVGSVPANIYDAPEVRPMIDHHDPYDIAGAQVGSLKKGIVGQRHQNPTNPLNPRYQMLDGDARPQPVPTHVAAGRSYQAHPMVQSRGQNASAPQLRSGGPTPQGSRPPSGAGSMRRGESAGSLRRTPQGQGSYVHDNYGGPGSYGGPGNTGAPGNYGGPGGTLQLDTGRSHRSGSSVGGGSRRSADYGTGGQWS